MSRPAQIKGLHVHRLSPERDNPEEVRFAKAWSSMNAMGSTLAYLLTEGDQQGKPPTPSPRDSLVAATIVQWLGSPVGQHFLSDLGYRKDDAK